MDLNKLSFWDLMNLILFGFYWVAFPIMYLFSKEPSSLWTVFMICVGVLELYYAISTLIHISSPDEILQAKKHWNILMQLRPRAFTAVVLLSGCIVVRMTSAIPATNMFGFISMLFGSLLIILAAKWWIDEIPRNDTLFNFNVPKTSDWL